MAFGNSFASIELGLLLGILAITMAHSISNLRVDVLSSLIKEHHVPLTLARQHQEWMCYQLLGSQEVKKENFLNKVMMSLAAQ